jgi:putative SbcD/Mre11-related phosphoesterase
MLYLRPLYPHPALLIEQDLKGTKRKYLVVSDLHIGFEAQMNLQGVVFDSKYTVNTMLEDLLGLIEAHHIDSVILLGDVKSTVRFLSKQEWNEVPSFFRVLSASTNVYLVPGNHDSNLGLLVPQNINIMSAKGMVLSGTLLLHGHTMPTTVRASVSRVIMGHIHPVFSKTDSSLNGQRIWLYLKVRKRLMFTGGEGLVDIIIMPSFNKEIHAMFHKKYGKSISPIVSRALEPCAIEEAMVATIDGSLFVVDGRLVANILS